MRRPRRPITGHVRHARSVLMRAAGGRNGDRGRNRLRINPYSTASVHMLGVQHIQHSNEATEAPVSGT